MCGMTDAQHRLKWDRPITLDYKDRNRKNNTMENLQTLCLSCHGAKDISWFLKLKTGPIYRSSIIQMRKEGKSYQHIADHLEIALSTVWTWAKKWEQEEHSNE